MPAAALFMYLHLRDIGVGPLIEGERDVAVPLALDVEAK